MAHPVRPQSYMEISNFYTATVYEKGAEVVRMIHTLIGRERFRRGMDLYFQRHDGQAVTTDDFVQAMQDASRRGSRAVQALVRPGRHAGAARLSGSYDARRAALHADASKQSCPPTPGQADEAAVPHSVRAWDWWRRTASDMPLRLEGEAARRRHDARAVAQRSRRQRFVFVDVPSAPVPSLLRGFSAPVIVKYDYGDAELTHLMAHDSDPFNRWEAGQRLALDLLLRGDRGACGPAARPSSPTAFVAAPSRACSPTAPRDPAFAAEALALPSESYIAEQMDVVDPDAIHAVRVALRRYLARALQRRAARRLSGASPCPGPTARTRARPASARCAICASAT